MNCPACGAEAHPGQKFCAECGTALAHTCPSCSSPYEPGQKFCAECGTALSATAPPGAPASAAPTAERRVVSVLFADLVGFTTLSESRDAEEVLRLE